MENKILVTGNLGYIGSVLTENLLREGFSIEGLDSGFFKDCNLTSINENKFKQILLDIRNINQIDLKRFHSIIHLAGLSNDPLGELNPLLTDEINFKASLNIAKKAKIDGVKKFIMTSSQSIYGISDPSIEIKEDGKKNPLTQYSISKLKAEIAINELADENFCVSFIRPATVFGSSPRIRTDIVFNNLLGSAFTTNKIIIKSDGSPWRPVIHINDVCSCLIGFLRAPNKLINKESFNLGIPNKNFKVSELAEAAKKIIPESEIIYSRNPNKDERTYKVNFDKITNTLGDFYNSNWSLEEGGKELLKFYKKIKLTDVTFNGEKTIRLKKLKNMIDNKSLNKNLYLSDK